MATQPKNTSGKATGNGNQRGTDKPAAKSGTGKSAAGKANTSKTSTGKSTTSKTNTKSNTGKSGAAAASAHTPQADGRQGEQPLAAIIGSNRIPFGKAGGAYADATNQDMLTAAMSGLIARYQLQGERLGDVAGGAVLKHSRNFNLTREAVLGTALDPQTPAFDLQRACATSVEAVSAIANKIKLGQITSGIAAGVDSTSDAPIVVTDRLRKTLLRLSRAKTVPQRLKLIGQLRPADLAPVAPNVNEPRTGLSMGEHQAITTRQWNITRQAQDEVALASHQNLAKAYDEGLFDDLTSAYGDASADVGEADLHRQDLRRECRERAGDV